MTDQPSFDINAAHKYFSASCFNQTWEYIDQPNRTNEDNMVMLQTAMASLWHWTQRADVKPENLSVGNWQVARVYTLLGQADNARRYAEVALKLAEGTDPFYMAFAYEALARAEMIAGDRAKMNNYLEKARKLAGQVTDEEDKTVLLKDLETIK